MYLYRGEVGAFFWVFFRFVGEGGGEGRELYVGISRFFAAMFSLGFSVSGYRLSRGL